MALDLIMGYYTIDLFTESRELTTIINEFSEFKYNRVPMVMCSYGDTYKAKAREVLGDNEGVKMYIDNILVFGKGVSSQHIDQIRVIFAWLRTTGIKVNNHM